MERPALQGLLADIRASPIDIVVIYKVDGLTRPLADFARLAEIFDAQGASVVSVTQQFNTTSSMAISFRPYLAMNDFAGLAPALLAGPRDR